MFILSGILYPQCYSKTGSWCIRKYILALCCSIQNYIAVCVEKQGCINSHTRTIRTASAWIQSSPPARLAYVLWGREAGPRSREGRSLCGQTGQSHPKGWVLRQQKRKTHLFSLLRTRWNVMVWSQTSQGGEYPRGKDRRKWFRERGKPKNAAPSSSSSVASNSPVVSEDMWMNLPSPCRQQRVLPSAWTQTVRSCGFTVASFWAGGGPAKVKLDSLCLSVFRVG